MRWWLQSLRISSIPCGGKPTARQLCTKLFIGGLSYDTNETVLRDAFRAHGEVVEVKVICDHVTSKSKGYGFVQFTSEREANIAQQLMDGQLLDGRNIRVDYAKKGVKDISIVQDNLYASPSPDDFICVSWEIIAAL